MQSLDKFYLRLQFKIRIYKLRGTEFQSFFEDVMVAADPRFVKVHPYGQQGDGGNDGFIREIGYYFQVYSPKDPSAKEKDVARKFIRDFMKLKRSWDGISEVKKYHFVFNDKYEGSSRPLETVLSEVKQLYPAIKFEFIFAIDIEKIFLQLPEDQIFNLGFSINSKDSQELITRLLEIIQHEIDRENVETAGTFLSALDGLIDAGINSEADVRYRLLKAAWHEQSENFDRAEEELQVACSTYRQDIRTKVRLAEIFFLTSKTKEGESLVAAAELIDPSSPHIKLQKILKVIRDDETFDPSSIDESTFPSEPRLKSAFYRLHGLILAINKSPLAEGFIQKAVELDPHRFKNRFLVVQNLVVKLQPTRTQDELISISTSLLVEADRIIEYFGGEEKIRPRNIAMLNLAKVQAHFQLGNRIAANGCLLSVLVNIKKCYLDSNVFMLLSNIMTMGFLDKRSIIEIEAFVKTSIATPPKSLILKFLCQYISNDMPLDNTESILNSGGDEKISALISAIRGDNADKVLELIGDDKEFGLELSQSIRKNPAFSARIIRSLDLSKSAADMMLVTHYHKIGQIEEVYKVISAMDLSSISVGEIEQILPVCHRINAVELELELLNKLLRFQSSSDALITKYRIFLALIRIPLFDQAITIGQEILDDGLSQELFPEEELQSVFYNTLVACIQRSIVDSNYREIGLDITTRFVDRFRRYDLLIGPVAGMYMANKMYPECFAAIVEAVVLNKGIEQSDYARLFFVLTVQLSQHIDFEKLYKVKEITGGTFVKLKGDSKWVHLGKSGLHNLKEITSETAIYEKLIGAKVGDTIDFSAKYSSQRIHHQVEKVCSVEGYIFWQVVEAFNELAPQNILPGVQGVHLPEVDGKLDTSNLIEMMNEISNHNPDVFNLYKKGGLPLAILAASQGGLLNALRKIIDAGEGYINLTNGSLEELEAQITTGTSTLDSGSPFYIDGTAALFLAEAGLLHSVLKNCPGLLVPASVLNYLISMVERIDESIPSFGNMNVRNGSLRITEHSKESMLRDKSKYTECIKYIESNRNMIRVISSINKKEDPIEANVPPELSDSCALARRDNVPVLTDDFLYLEVSAKLLNYSPLKYFSSITLLKILVDRKIFSYDDYLDYVNLACAYRCRFISISCDDFTNAVFGTGKIKTVNLGNLDKLNIGYTFSPEYGASQRDCMRIMCQFILSLLHDDTVVSEVVEDIFVKIVTAFPTTGSKVEFANTVLSICQKASVSMSKSTTIYLGKNGYEAKIQSLRRRIDLLA